MTTIALNRIVPQAPHIKNDEHVFIAGRTGSGKSTLVEVLLLPIKRLVVIDSKDGLSSDSWNLDDFKNKDMRLIKGEKPYRLRIVEDETALDVLEAVYDAGNAIVYVDELTALIPNPAKRDRRFFNIWERGRSRMIGAWVSTQAPVSIPLTTLRNSTHFFCFKLNLLDDRKRMSEVMGKEILGEIKNKYGFWYYNSNTDFLRYYSRMKI